jgi:hypothetical protein
MMTYSDLVLRFVELGGTIQADINLPIAIPAAIDAAENRCYRDLDLLATVVADISGTFTAGNSLQALPSGSGTMVVLDQLIAYTTGTTVNLLPVSLAYLYATGSQPNAIPQYFAMRDQFSVTVSPTPDQDYGMLAYGTVRPAPLGSSNITTLLTTYFPDMFTAAAMSFALQSQTASPLVSQQAQQWETNYQTLLKSALVEENRKKFYAEGWSSKQPSPIVTPPRT